MALERKVSSKKDGTKYLSAQNPDVQFLRLTFKLKDLEKYTGPRQNEGAGYHSR